MSTSSSMSMNLMNAFAMTKAYNQRIPSPTAKQNKHYQSRQLLLFIMIRVAILGCGVRTDGDIVCSLFSTSTSMHALMLYAQQQSDTNSYSFIYSDDR